jgi:type II secretory pathway pseudopilin PulG
MKRIDRSLGAGREAGFTLIELLITLTITVAIMTVVLTAVDLNANITRVQSDVTDLQQSTRVAQRDMQRLVRMIGRGGLPRPLALAVAQDADNLAIGGQAVVDETDVLTIRGSFESPVFRIDVSDPNAFQQAGNNATLMIDSMTKSAYSQPLAALQALLPLNAAKPPAILLVGSQGDAVFAVTALTALTISPPFNVDIQNQSRQITRATLTLTIAPGASPHSGDYLALSSTPGSMPGNLNTVSFASIVEEYKFFIREDFTIPGDNTSPPSPKLARAHMLPGTDVLHADGAIDIADNVYDLQVALGIDIGGGVGGLPNGRIDVENSSGAALAGNADEWLWNHPGDNLAAGWDAASLQHVRMTILGKAQTADRQYIAPAIATLENRIYNEPPIPTDPDEITARRHRRRVLQSSVDLRNL